MTPATAAAAELDWERAVAWLYVPAVRPDRFTQAAAVADGVIIDLEDAVHPSRRAEARENLTRLEHEPLAAPVVVRVNPPTSRDFAPLPVLGVPGWWPANESPAFYADATVFRPGRRNRR